MQRRIQHFKFYSRAVLGCLPLLCKSQQHTVNRYNVPNMYLRYQNLSLVDQYGKHSEFPGLSFWHFCKTEEIYRRFSDELLIAEPLLSGIKKLGKTLTKYLLKVLLVLFFFRKDLCALFIHVSDISKAWSVNIIRLKQLVILETYLRKLINGK